MKKATNSALMRAKNEKMILSLINKKAISRVQIAKETGLTKAAVTIITDKLIKKGIITEKRRNPNSRAQSINVVFKRRKHSFYRHRNLSCGHFGWHC